MNALCERRPDSDADAPEPPTNRSLAAAIAYLLAWVAGLSVFSSSTEVRASGAEVLANFRDHETAAATQYVLTEGLTAVLLVVALWPLGRTLSGRRVLLGSLLAATVVSFAELVLGVRLVTGDLGPSAASTVYDTINRLDGVKMLALAVVVAVVTRGARRTLPTWFLVLGAGTVTTLVLSGLGYLTLDDGLATCAWVSLPLLIVTVLAVGVLSLRSWPRGGATRRDHRRSGAKTRAGLG